MKRNWPWEDPSRPKRVKLDDSSDSQEEVHDRQLKVITDASEYPVVIHGTDDEAYKSIAREGLKTMGKNHIHFAAGEPGENGVISGMRATCKIMIYLNLPKALQDGLEFFLSENGVILSPGNEDGIIPTVYFDKVIDRRTGSLDPNQQELVEELQSEIRRLKTKLATSHIMRYVEKKRQQRTSAKDTRLQVEEAIEEVKFQYKEVLSTELQCSICFDVLNNAEITNCGHTYCRECLRRWLATKNVCPTCKADVFSHSKNYVAQHLIRTVGRDWIKPR